MQHVKIITSLNRYDPKKNIPLALKAFSKYVKETKANALLVIAGGYDESLLANVYHYIELVNLAKELNIYDKTVFLRSISND